MIETLLGVTQKKVFMCPMEKKKVKFRRISTVSLIHHTMRTKVSKNLCPHFAGFFPYFQRFCPDFCQIKTLGVALLPSGTPTCYTTTVETGLEIKYRHSITAIHGIKYRYLTNSLKISMQYSC